ncbi:hypothetical protein [Mycobacterium sp.]|uniref:hypothetical protein n=1 Tax=Mycobacterium sp. TaxID=1785 RepID=UPI0039C8FD37
MNRYEQALADVGLLSGPASGAYADWLANAERQEVAPVVVAEVAQRHQISPDSFAVLRDMERITDPAGKSFFVIPPRTGGDDARQAVLMTYIFNAGTDYGRQRAVTSDFPATPYSAAEVQRIVDRQRANRWSYNQDLGFVDRNGARLVATPNGILMGLGGNWMQRLFSQQGGTTWGEIFLINMSPADPVELLRLIVESGHAWYADHDGRPCESNLALDRVLHHEERHCAQWAAKGYVGMIRDYSWELVRERVFRKPNRLEDDAGLSDGGYR